MYLTTRKHFRNKYKKSGEVNTSPLYEKTYLKLNYFLRRIATNTKATKPAINAYVDGSGTAVTSKEM